MSHIDDIEADQSPKNDSIAPKEITTQPKGVALIKAEFIVPKTDCKNVVEPVQPEKPSMKRKATHKIEDPSAKKSFRLCQSSLKPVILDTDGVPQAVEKPCQYKECKYSHEIPESDDTLPSLAGPCPVLANRGCCPSGQTCRWFASHLDVSLYQGRKGILVSEAPDPTDPAFNCDLCCTTTLTKDLTAKLRKRKYDFTRANAIIKAEQHDKLKNQSSTESTKPTRDKKPIDFRNKLYLAPLTTVGNLPFRRICKEFGADITCSEMIMVKNIVSGLPREWALTKRHPTEDLFGVQICGNHVDQVARCGQLLDEHASFDFIDLNCGCPIDSVFNVGAGSSLIRNNNANRIVALTRSLNSVLRNALVTVKMRTGVAMGKNTAHSLIPQICSSGMVALITMHGRTREQRYTKLADWDYTTQCAKLAASANVPFFGNGDVLSWEDYQRHMHESGENLAGCMIARGALIKPWLFQEIKEQRTWDISSKERMEILQKFVNYGLEHWGSDRYGVENTRRFLLEWLSFTHRYIPVGLLERPPQKINEKPPLYQGRDYLETLLSSPKCKDWITISEICLGKVSDQFRFEPKHKANSYE